MKLCHHGTLNLYNKLFMREKTSVIDETMPLIQFEDEPIAPAPRVTFGASATSNEPLVHGGSGGHYQMNYESARLPSKDMWKIPEKQETFMEYQLRKQAQPNQQMGK